MPDTQDNDSKKNIEPRENRRSEFVSPSSENTDVELKKKKLDNQEWLASISKKHDPQSPQNPVSPVEKKDLPAPSPTNAEAPATENDTPAPAFPFTKKPPVSWLDKEMADSDDDSFEPIRARNPRNPRNASVSREFSGNTISIKERSLLWSAIVFFIVVGAIASYQVYHIGIENGQAEVKRNQAAAERNRKFELSADDAVLLETLFSNIAERKDLKETGEAMTLLAEKYPDIPSMNYIAALTALQASDFETCERIGRESILRRDRIGDTLTIQSIVEQSQRKFLSDPRVRVVSLLEQALTADPIAYSPRIEMATLRRNEGKSDEAAVLYRSALARMYPVDPRVVCDTALAFIDIEEQSEATLSAEMPSSHDPRVLFPEAYKALILDNNDLAVQILNVARDKTDPFLFYYLMNDRAFQRFSYRPMLKPFFKTDSTPAAEPTTPTQTLSNPDLPRAEEFAPLQEFHENEDRDANPSQSDLLPTKVEEE